VRDHVTIAGQLPAYLGAYLGPNAALAPKLTEAIMMTMNSIDACPYCTGLHGELARMAGTDEETYASAPVTFAKVFAAEAGRGGAVDVALGELKAAEGAARARSTRALCFALLWGKTTGNTINSFRDGALRLQSGPFHFLVTAFYGPLFAVIGALNAGLARLPPIPAAASTALGAVLWVPQAIHIAALGALCVPLKLAWRL
jgi:AhpD family alkylhydroperoxidase